MTKKRLLIAGGVVLALVAVYAVMRERPVPVEMAQAATRTVREYISEEAKTRLDDDITVDTPLSGTVERISLKEGDRVQAGQCVAQIDAFSLEQQIAGIEALIGQARARISGVDVEKPKPEDLASAILRIKEERDSRAMAQRERSIAQNNYNDAEREYRRIKALFDAGAVSQSQYDDADRACKNAKENLERASLAETATSKALEIAELASQKLQGSIDDNEYMREVYKAEVENLQAQLNVLKDELAKSEVTAPVDGVVLEKFIDDKRVLAAGTPLLRIGDMSSIEIECDVLSEEVGRVHEGDPVEITGKALNDETIMGAIERVYPAGFKKISALGIEQQRVRTIIAFDNSKVQLRPGTSVDVRIITGEEDNAVAVPERATFRQDDGWAVFVVEGGRARLTPVEVGLKNDDWATIKTGVESGQTIVAEPKNELKDGMRVAALE